MWKKISSLFLCGPLEAPVKYCTVCGTQQKAHNKFKYDEITGELLTKKYGHWYRCSCWRYRRSDGN